MHRLIGTVPVDDHLAVKGHQSHAPVGMFLLHLLQLVVHSGLRPLEARHVGDVARLAGQVLVLALCVQCLESIQPVTPHGDVARDLGEMGEQDYRGKYQSPFMAIDA